MDLTWLLRRPISFIPPVTYRDLPGRPTTPSHPTGPLTLPMTRFPSAPFAATL